VDDRANDQESEPWKPECTLVWMPHWMRRASADDKSRVFARLDARLSARLRGLREVALGLIEGEIAGRHQSHLRGLPAKTTTGCPACSTVFLARAPTLRHVSTVIRGLSLVGPAAGSDASDAIGASI